MNKSIDNIDDRTLVVLNCHKNVTEELLYELFVQAGPVQNVKKRKACPHAFVTFFHSESVPYTIKVMNGIRLFGQPLRLRPRPHTKHCYGEPNECDYPEPLWCVLVPYPREDYVREIRKMNDRIRREQQQQQRERYARNMRNTYPGSSYHFNTHDARHYDSYRFTYWNQGYYENERGRHGKQYRGNAYKNSRASYSSANYGKSTRPKQQYKKGHPPAR